MDRSPFSFKNLFYESLPAAENILVESELKQVNFDTVYLYKAIYNLILNGDELISKANPGNYEYFLGYEDPLLNLYTAGESESSHSILLSDETFSSILGETVIIESMETIGKKVLENDAEGDSGSNFTDKAEIYSEDNSNLLIDICKYKNLTNSNISSGESNKENIITKSPSTSLQKCSGQSTKYTSLDDCTSKFSNVNNVSCCINSVPEDNLDYSILSIEDELSNSMLNVSIQDLDKDIFKTPGKKSIFQRTLIVNSSASNERGSDNDNNVKNFESNNEVLKYSCNSENSNNNDLFAIATDLDKGNNESSVLDIKEDSEYKLNISVNKLEQINFPEDKSVDTDQDIYNDQTLTDSANTTVHKSSIPVKIKLNRSSIFPSSTNVDKSENLKAYEKPFVSDDPRENEDNLNPQWKSLRSLKTDEDRYSYIRSRWKNVIIPDPHADLTFFAMRVSKSNYFGSVKRNRLHSDGLNNLPVSKRRRGVFKTFNYPVSEFDRAANKVLEDYYRKKYYIDLLKKSSFFNLQKDCYEKLSQIELAKEEVRSLMEFYAEVGISSDTEGCSTYQQLKDTEEIYYYFRYYYNWNGELLV